MSNPDVYLAVGNVILLLALSGTLLAWHRANSAVSQSTRLRLMMEQNYRDQLRRAEEEIIRSRRARATFLAAANHDLRQPLQAMCCFSAVLAQRLRGRSRQAAVSLQQSLDVLNTHIETLVDLSRLEAGILEPRLRPVAAAMLLEDVAGEFGPLAAAKGLRLSVVRCNLTVISDPDMLRRALDNLVGNAVRFTESGGIVLGCRRRGERLRFEVWDSGIGIASDQLERVFEEFYQVGNPHRDRTNGLGLGLAVVDRLVRLLPDHALSVTSQLGCGSTFAVEVPMDRPRRLPVAAERYIDSAA